MARRRVWENNFFTLLAILSILIPQILLSSNGEYSYEDLWKIDKNLRISELKREIERIEGECVSLQSFGYGVPNSKLYACLSRISEINRQIEMIDEEEAPMLVYMERFLPYAEEYDYLDKSVLELLPYVEEDNDKYPLVSMAIEKAEGKKNKIMAIVSPELFKKVEREQKILKAKIVASVGVSLIPIAGGVKDYLDYKNGVDVIADVPLSSWEMSMAPFFIGASVFDLSILKSVKRLKVLGKATRVADGSESFDGLRRFARKLELDRAASWVTFKALSRAKSSAESVINGLYRTLYFARKPLKSIDELYDGLRVSRTSSRTLIVSPGFGNVRMSRTVLDFLRTRYDRVVELTLEEGRTVLKPLYSENHVFLSVGGSGIAHNRSAETLGNLFYERLVMLRERGFVGDNISLLGHSYAGLFHRVAMERIGKDGTFVVDDVISVGGTHYVAGSIANQVDPFRLLVKEGVRHSMYAKSAITSMSDEGVALLNKIYPIDTTAIRGKYYLVATEITSEFGSLLQRVVTKVERGDGLVKSEAQLARGVPVAGDESRIVRLLFGGSNHYQQTSDVGLFERIFERIGN